MKLKFIKNIFYVKIHRKNFIYKILKTSILNFDYELISQICYDIYFSVKDDKNFFKNTALTVYDLNINSKFLTIKYTDFYLENTNLENYPFMIYSDKIENIFKLCHTFKNRCFYIEKSDLFYFSGKYYLFIFPRNGYYTIFENLILPISDCVKVNKIFYQKINEFGISIIKNNAIEKIIDYFNES